MNTSANHQILSEDKNRLLGTWLLAFLWNIPMVFVFIETSQQLLERFEQEPKAYLIGIFPILGIFLICIAIKKTRAWYKFGKAAITITTFPVKTGEKLTAYIDLPVILSDAKKAKLVLTCVHQYRQNGEIKKSATWQDIITVTPHRYTQHTRFEFSFNLPANCPKSELESDNYYFWQLHIKVPLSGLNFDRFYTIPVEKGESLPVAESQYEPTTLHTVELSQFKTKSNPKITQTASGVLLSYNRGRSKAIAIILCILALAIAYFDSLFFNNFPEFLPITAKLIAIYFGLVSLLLFAIVFFLVANRLTVEVNSKGILKKQQLFKYVVTEMIESENIVDIIPEKGISAKTENSFHGTSYRVWYDLIVVTADKQRVNIGEKLGQLRNVEEIRQLVINALGRQWQPAVETLEPDNQFIPKPIELLLRYKKPIYYSMIFAFVSDIALKI